VLSPILAGLMLEKGLHIADGGNDHGRGSCWARVVVFIKSG